MPAEEVLICFYTTKPFWACEVPSRIADHLQQCHSIPPEMEAEWTRTLFENVVELNTTRFDLKIARDGLIQIAVHDLLDKLGTAERNNDMAAVSNLRATYVSYLNAFQLLLDSAVNEIQLSDMISVEPLRQSDVFPIYYQEGRFAGGGMAAGAGGNNFLLRFPRTISALHMLMYGKKELIKRETLDCAIEQFRLACESPDAIILLNYLSAAFGNYANYAFGPALVNTWHILEYFVDATWNDYVASAGSKIESLLTHDRRAFLSGRDFTSSIATHVLLLAGKIPPEEFFRIDNVRKRRNDQIHRIALKRNESTSLVNKTITKQDCIDAFDAAAFFLRASFAINISPKVRLAWSGWHPGATGTKTAPVMFEGE